MQKSRRQQIITELLRLNGDELSDIIDEVHTRSTTEELGPAALGAALARSRSPLLDLFSGRQEGAQ